MTQSIPTHESPLAAREGCAPPFNAALYGRCRYRSLGHEDRRRGLYRLRTRCGPVNCDPEVITCRAC
jgi:hypothetical protein